MSFLTKRKYKTKSILSSHWVLNVTEFRAEVFFPKVANRQLNEQTNEANVICLANVKKIGIVYGHPM